MVLDRGPDDRATSATPRSRSRIAASTSTPGSTCTRSCAPRPWTSVTGRWSRAAPRSPSSWSRTSTPGDAADASAQGRRGGPGDPDGAAVLEGRDPHELPQHRVLRRGRLRHRSGGRDLLRQVTRASSRSPESAMLAGLITSPEPLRPVRAPELGARAPQRRAADHASDGHDLAATRGGARRRRRLDVRRRDVRGPVPLPLLRRLRQAVVPGEPRVRRTYDDRYRLLFTGGLRITTTLDPAVQAAAQDAVSSVLSYPGDPDAAVTVLDPRTGFVRAMVGGKDADYWADESGRPRQPRDRRGGIRAADGVVVQGRSRWWRRSRTATHPTRRSPRPASITSPLPGRRRRGR